MVRPRTRIASSNAWMREGAPGPRKDNSGSRLIRPSRPATFAGIWDSIGVEDVCPVQEEVGMKLRARVWVLMIVCGLVLAVALPAGAQAIGIEKFVATNCEEQECGEETGEGFKEPKPIATAEEKEELTEEGFSQAGGRVPFGVTDFLVQSVGKYPEKIPTAAT